MKKDSSPKKKLRLSRETVRVLTIESSRLRHVAGGVTYTEACSTGGNSTTWNSCGTNPTNETAYC